MIFSGMTSSNTAEYKFYLKSGVIKFQFIIIINCEQNSTQLFQLETALLITIIVIK